MSAAGNVPDRDGNRNPPDAEPEDLTRTVVRGAGFAGAGYILAQSLTFVAYMVLARLATPTDFGEFAAAAVVVNIAGLFTEAGMLGALIHRRDRIDEAASTAVAATWLGGLGFALIALAVSPLIGLIFDSSRVAALAAAMSGLILVRSIQTVPEAILQRRFSFLRRLVIQPCQVIVFGVTAIIATSNGMGPWGLVLGTYASAAVEATLSWSLVRWRPRLGEMSFSMWRELISYGRHILISNIIMGSRDAIPTLLIGRFVGKSPLGQYQYGGRMSLTAYALLLNAAAYVVFPALSRISEDRERFKVAFVRALGSFAGLAFPLGMLFVPFGISAAVLVFGEPWREAGYVSMPLGAGTAMATLAALAAEAFKAAGIPRILVTTTAISTIVGAAAMVALLPFGLIGVSIGVTIGISASAVYGLHRIRTEFDIPLRAMAVQIWPPALSATLMAAVMLPIDRVLLDPSSMEVVAGVAVLSAETLAALALYAVALSITGPHIAREALSALERLRRR